MNVLPMNVLMTGASGVVGRATVAALRASNGLDGNNIENVHINTIIDGLNLVAAWDNSGDTNTSPTPIDLFTPLVHGDVLAGFGGGQLDDVTVGGASLLDGNILDDLFHSLG